MEFVSFGNLLFNRPKMVPLPPMNTLTFDLQMNPMVRNLLVSALGTCKFAMMHENHPVSRAIREFKVFDDRPPEVLLQKIKDAKDGQMLKLTLDDELLIYAAMDITCKAYLTDLGDELEQVSRPMIQQTGSSYQEIRTTLLKGCQFVMQGMREKLAGIAEFDDLTDILDNYFVFD